MAAEQLDEREGRLDILVNNAGITDPCQEATDAAAGDAEAVFATDVVGPVRVLHAFLPLLERSSHPVIVNVSSGLRSFAAVHDPDRPESQVMAPVYCASKNALNMLTVRYARALPRMCINTADPGGTAADLNGHRGKQIVEEGTDAIVRLATFPPDGPTGVFIDRHGPMPWQGNP